MIYKTAEKISREGLETKFGFIHMPWIDRYVMPPSSSQGSPEKYTVPEGKAVMPLEEVVKGLELIIERA